MLRWSVSRFSAANIWYGTAPITRGMKPYSWYCRRSTCAGYPGRYAHRASDLQRKTPFVERVIRRVNERIPVAYLTNKRGSAAMNFTSMNACWYRARDW